MTKTTTITEGQSLLDVALQEAGTIAAVFELADAAGLSITDMLSAGMVLEVPITEVDKYDVVAFYASRAYRVNTGDKAVPAPVATTQRYFSSLFFNPEHFA